MRLAEDEISITIGRETVYVRPTLRAAFRLERRYGFDGLMRAILDGNLTVMADVIHECADNETSIPGILSSIGLKPLRLGVESLTAPMTSLVFALAGVDPDQPASAATGNRVTFAEHHARLFQIGTGWLGWSPEDTWNATAVEITEAYKGRLEMLGAAFGVTSAKPDSDPTNADLDQVGWAKLKFFAATGRNRAA